MKDNELFLQRIRSYFPLSYNEFLNELNSKATNGFFINSNKGNIDEIESLIDFDYNRSFVENSFYHQFEGIGKTKAYELGLIYPQDIESALPSKLPDTTNVKLVIDLCAAPGGKSINIYNRLSSDSLLISNDVSYKRASVLYSNLERLGLNNGIVTSLPVNKLADIFEDCADIVILDAPCSGEGMIRKYPEILAEYNLGNILNLAKTQAELLENAYRMLKKNGQLIYSTCTYAFEEDEDQILNFLDLHKDMSLMPFEIDNNYSTLKGTIKLCPLNNCEGQFMALLSKNEGTSKLPKYEKTVSNKIVETFIEENLNISNYYLYRKENYFYLSFVPIPVLNFNVLSFGLFIGELKKDRFEPSHSLYRCNLLKDKFKNIIEINDKEYSDYIQGLSINRNINDGYYLINYHNFALGFGKCSNSQIKNKYPKGLRRVL